MKYWIALAVCLLALGGLSACGGGGNKSKEDARVGAIGTLSEHAVDSWVKDGPQGLYIVLHQDIQTQCSESAFEVAMADQPVPTAWRNTKDIVLADDLNHATATVIIVAGGQDIEQQWSFELENGVRWRVSDVPGLSNCINS